MAYSKRKRSGIPPGSILRIPVCMHKVESDKIQRPSYRNVFGIDKEASDYRACETLGPLYGKK
jgi:L-fucose isomerase